MSESLLDARWRALRAAGRAALIPYVTAGYPDAGATASVLAGAAAAGADLVELGVPWSDPVADGPVIQASAHAALARGMSLAGVLALLQGARPGVPVVLMSYVNPILQYGAARFAADAQAAGAAGLLVTDLPAGADPATESALRAGGMPLVRLAAPTSAPLRLREIAAASDGFVYLVARLGVTGRGGGSGDRGIEKTELRAQVAALREVTTLPIAVGFGISEPGDAAEVAAIADGAVVGSAVIEKLTAGGAPAALAFLGELRSAMDRERRAA